MPTGIGTVIYYLLTIAVAEVMGTAIDSLGTAAEITTENPLLLGITFLVTVGAFVISGILSFIPLIGQLIATPVTALLFSGIVGAVYVAIRTGRGISFSGYTAAIENKWKSILGAYTVLVLLQIGIGIALFVLLFFVVGFSAFGASTAGGMEGSSGPGAASMMAGVGAVTLLVFLAFFLVLALLGMIVQFLDVAIVVGDFSAIEAYSEAWSLFAEAPLSVIGYSLLRGFVTFLGILPAVVVAWALWGSDPMVAIGVAGLVGVVGLTVAFAYAWSYHTAYYVSRRPESVDAA